MVVVVVTCVLGVSGSASGTLEMTRLITAARRDRHAPCSFDRRSRLELWAQPTAHNQVTPWCCWVSIIQWSGRPATKLCMQARVRAGGVGGGSAPRLPRGLAIAGLG